jgi:hypothetical protein
MVRSATAGAKVADATALLWIIILRDYFFLTNPTMASPMARPTFM